MKYIKIVLRFYKIHIRMERGKMNERKIFFRVLVMSLIVLAIAFVLLFVYVDTRWWDLKSSAINPIHTVIATVAMIVIGMIVYVERKRKC